MFPENIIITVQNIQLLGINGCVQNSVVLMIMVSEIIYYIGNIFTMFTGFPALRFTEAGSPLAAKRILILPMNQHF
jgi:hypothetical protein